MTTKFIVEWYVTEQVDRDETRNITLRKAILEAKTKEEAEKLAEGLREAVHMGFYYDNGPHVDADDISVCVTPAGEYLDALTLEGNALLRTQADLDGEAESETEEESKVS